jgi:hypothetical protein
MTKKSDTENLAGRDLRQEAWEREMFSKPLRAWTMSDRIRYWMQPKRLKVQLAMVAIGAALLWSLVVRGGL